MRSPLADIGSPATVWSPDVSGTQGCLREPVEGGVYAILWECAHAHRSDEAALRCAEKEYERQRAEVIANAPSDAWWLAANDTTEALCEIRVFAANDAPTVGDGSGPEPEPWWTFWVMANAALSVTSISRDADG